MSSMSTEQTILVTYPAHHPLRLSAMSTGNTSPRSTLFTASQPSEKLAPYTPRPPPSPPVAPHLAALGRSSSLRSERSAEATDLTPDSAVAAVVPLPPAPPTIQTPPGYSSRPSSLKPRPLPSPLHPRRRSWFREEDPSAFGPPSPDPVAALSPMAQMRNSMSEDEQKEDLLPSDSVRPSSRGGEGIDRNGRTSSNSSPRGGTSQLAPSPSLSPSSHPVVDHRQGEPQTLLQSTRYQPYTNDSFSSSSSATNSSKYSNNRPFSIIGNGEKDFLALPSRSHSDRNRDRYGMRRGSNPSVVVVGTGGDEEAEMQRRASDSGSTSDAHTPAAPGASATTTSMGVERSPSLVSGPRLNKGSVWERSFSRREREDVQSDP